MNESLLLQTSNYFKKQGITLPKISELSNPLSIKADIQKILRFIDKNA